MIIKGQVGPSLSADGPYIPPRLDRTGAFVVQQLHGRYFEQTLRRAMFSGAIIGQVTTVGLATTYTGLCLSNPFGSPVNLVLGKCGYAFTVVWPAVAVVGLMAGYSLTGANVTHTTPVTPRNNYFTGAGGGVGLLDSAAGLPTAPVVMTVFQGASTGTAAVPPLVQGLVDMEGSIIIPPGGYVAFYTSTVSGAAGGAFSFQWEEVSI